MREIDEMGKKDKLFKIDEELYKEFKDYVKRTQGKIHGNLSLAVEDALRLYMNMGIDPENPETGAPGIYDQLQRGGRGTPQSYQVKDDLFIIEFKNRFEGYQLIGSGELKTFIQSETAARSDKTIKKWRNKIRDRGLIVYVKNNMWRMAGSDTDKQTSLSRYSDVYNKMELGKTISFQRIKEICNKTERETKEIITHLENEGRLIHLGPGSWKVVSPENMADPGVATKTLNEI